MNAPVIVRVGRTNIVGVDFGGDISAVPIGDWKSEIRKGKSITSDLIATWDLAFETDGTDGLLVMTLDDSVTTAIAHSTGWMDIKKIENGEPVSAFAQPIQVIFEGVVTA